MKYIDVAARGVDRSHTLGHSQHLTRTGYEVVLRAVHDELRECLEPEERPKVGWGGAG